VALLNLTIGCSTIVQIPASELKGVEDDSTSFSHPIQRIAEVTVTDGTRITFDWPGAEINSDSVRVTGTLEPRPRQLTGKPYSITLDSVETISYRKDHPMSTMFILAGLTATALLVLAVSRVSSVGGVGQ